MLKIKKYKNQLAKDTREYYFVWVLFLLCLLMACPVLADDGAVNDGAYGIVPFDVSKGMESKIQMKKEYLYFEFGKKYTKVIAKFWFKNTDPKSTVIQMSGFPDEAFARPNTVIGKIENIETFVDGKAIDSPLKFGYVKYYTDFWVPSNDDKGLKMGWYIIELSIPPDGEKVVERHYKTKNGISFDNSSFFYYILHTAATWHGIIGNLIVDVKLNDGLTAKDLLWPSFLEESKYKITMYPGKEDWKILDDNHLKLVWYNLNPREQKSKRHLQIAFSMVKPKRKFGQWMVTSSNKFTIGNGYEIIYNVENNLVSFLEVGSNIALKATKGSHLSDYLKPGDVIDYDGMEYSYSAIRIQDSGKDIFKIRKHK